MPEFAQLARSIALEAGEIMLRHFGVGIAHTLKEDHTPLTEADGEISDLMLRRIGSAYPNHRVIGEEGSSGGEAEYAWVCDPIDGTGNFLRGIPMNVFALALVKDGEPVLGVVYDPYLKRLYRATKGGGAFMNDAPIATSDRTEFPGSTIVCDGLRGFKDLDFIQELRREKARFFSYGSIVYSHMLVASGQIDGVIFPIKYAWDSAAAKVIVEEAGGVTSDIRGAAQRYDGDLNGFISAGNPQMHARLVGIVSGSLNDV